jgi:hypothetical protein
MSDEPSPCLHVLPTAVLTTVQLYYDQVTVVGLRIVQYCCIRLRSPLRLPVPHGGRQGSRHSHGPYRLTRVGHDAVSLRCQSPASSRGLPRPRAPTPRAPQHLRLPEPRTRCLARGTFFSGVCMCTCTYSPCKLATVIVLVITAHSSRASAAPPRARAGSGRSAARRSTRRRPHRRAA